MLDENLKQIIDWKKDNFGDYSAVNSNFRSDRVWTPVSDIDEKLIGTEVLVRGRVQ